MLMCAVLPTYDSNKNKDGGQGKMTINAEDPANDALIDKVLG